MFDSYRFHRVISKGLSLYGYLALDNRIFLNECSTFKINIKMVKTELELRQELAKVQRNKRFFAVQSLKNPEDKELAKKVQDLRNQEVIIKEGLSRD